MHEIDIDVGNLFLEIADGALDLVFDTKGAGFIEPVSRSIQYLFVPDVSLGASGRAVE